MTQAALFRHPAPARRRARERKIQFRFDNLEARRRLGVAANPVAVAVSDSGGLPNRSYISGCTAAMQALSRVLKFEYSSRAQSLQAEPLKIIAVDDAGLRGWHPTQDCCREGPRRPVFGEITSKS